MNKQRKKHAYRIGQEPNHIHRKEPGHDFIKGFIMPLEVIPTCPDCGAKVCQSVDASYNYGCTRTYGHKGRHHNAILGVWWEDGETPMSRVYLTNRIQHAKLDAKST